MPDESTRQNQEYQHLSRRKALQLGGLSVGLATGLAGCSSEDGTTTEEQDATGSDGQNDPGQDSDGDSGSEPIDGVFDVEGTVPPTDFQYNPWNANNYGGTRAFVYDQLVFYYPTEGEIAPNVVTDWSVDDGSVTVTLREQTWHDGDPVTADDLVAQFQILKYLDFGVWDLLESVEASDDRTVVFNLDGQVNEGLLLQKLLLGRNLNSKRSIFAEWVDRFENASGDDEIEEIQSELVSMTLDEPLGNSPWRMNTDQTSPASGYYEVYEDHPVAGDLNFDLKRHADSETSTMQQRLINDELDSLLRESTPQSLVDRLPDHFELFRTPQPYSMDYSFDHSHEIWGRPAARRAFAYLIDSLTWVTNADRQVNYIPIETVTGIRANAESWIPSDTLDSFTNYGADSIQQDKAAQEMEAAGFTRDDGTWYTEGGDPVTATITTPSTNPTTKGGQTTVSVLNDFGIDAEMETRDTGAFIGSGWPNGDYTIGLWLSRFANTYHPYDNLYGSFLGTLANANNFPSTVEVPMPIGDPDGDLTEIDLQSRLSDLNQSASGEREIIAELAWVYNQLLPSYPIANVRASRVLSNDAWDYDADDPLFQTLQENAVVYSGKVTAKTN